MNEPLGGLPRSSATLAISVGSVTNPPEISVIAAQEPPQDQKQNDDGDDWRDLLSNRGSGGLEEVDGFCFRLVDLAHTGAVLKFIFQS